VEVFQAAQNGDDYRIALLGPGDFFGEMALITGGRRTASAKANTPVELLPLNQEDMLNGIRSDPETGHFFLHVLINRLRAITDALEQPEKSLQTLRQAVIPVIKRTEIVSMGISSLSSCGGCAAVFVRDPQELSWITQNVDVSYCPMLMDQEEIKDVIFAVVDGAVRTRENEEKLIEVRRKSRFLIALGTCAVFGGIPALANSYDLEELISESYGRTTDPFLYYLADNGFEHETATPYLEAHLLRKVRNVSDVVRVDYFLPGCPPVLGLLIDLLKELQGEHLPGVNRQIVCKECTRKHRRSSLDSLRVFPTTADKKELCFLSSGVMCMGLLTRGGCRAACPGGGLPCWGCRGPSNSVIAKINRGETFEEVMLWSLARRLKKDASKIKPVLKILRLKGGSALNFDQNFIKDVSKIR
jgi:F420-non-reducing hydrogenase small subunit